MAVWPNTDSVIGVMKIVIGNIYRGPPPPASHTGLSRGHDERVCRSMCYQVDVLFYSGEEVGAATGEPAPNSRGEDGRGLAWE